MSVTAIALLVTLPPVTRGSTEVPILFRRLKGDDNAKEQAADKSTCESSALAFYRWSCQEYHLWSVHDDASIRRAHRARVLCWRMLKATCKTDWTNLWSPTLGVMARVYKLLDDLELTEISFRSQPLMPAHIRRFLWASGIMSSL